VHRTLDVVTDGGRRVEEDNAVLGGEKGRLVGTVSDPVEVPLDTSDVVALLVQGGTERPPGDRRVVRQILGTARARVGICLGCRVWCVHGRNREATSGPSNPGIP